MLLLAAPTLCPIDRALLREDLDFARDAESQHIGLRRLVGVGCGHSVYVGPEVAARGWTPAPDGPRRCGCGTIMPGVGRRVHGVGPRRCRACRGLAATCTACGTPMDEASARQTCGLACQTAAANRVLAKMRERKTA